MNSFAQETLQSVTENGNETSKVLYLNNGSFGNPYTGNGIQGGSIIGPGGYWAVRNGLNNSFNIDVNNNANAISGLSILQTGNVGIGTSVPDTKLHIIGEQNYNWVATIENKLPQGHIVYFGYNNGTTKYGLNITGGSNDINSLDLLVGANKFIVRGDGNVGIGTTTPSPDSKLDVNGTANFSGEVNTAVRVGRLF